MLYATAEDTWKSTTPRFDLQSRLKQKADIIGLDWNKIRENLFVLDTVAYPERARLDAYKFVNKKKEYKYLPNILNKAIKEEEEK